MISDAELNAQESTPNAPPEYGRHQLDELYNDILTSGYMSRAGSGSNTPFFAQSRHGSSENLQSLSALADTNYTATNGEINSALLQSRLANLQENSRFSRSPANHSPSGGNTPYNGTTDHDLPLRPTPPSVNPYFNTASSHHSSGVQSRRNSGDSAGVSGIAGVHQQDYDLGTLSRVPSYGAATRISGAMTPFNEGPPSYIDATSRPPSPIQRPSAAHVRSGVSTPTSNSSGNTLTGHTDGMSALTSMIHGQSAGGSDVDDEARLRLMRARVG